MSTRSKRKTAAKVIIVDTSDSEEESASTSKKRRQSDADFQFVSEKAPAPLKKSAKASRSNENSKKRGSQKKPANSDPLVENRRNQNIEPNQPLTEVTDGNALQRTISSARRSVRGACRRIWDIHELLSEKEQIEPRAARNIVELFSQENTVPFLCRYRRDLIDHISPERLRDIKKTYTEIVGLRKKAEHIVTQLEKEHLINENVRSEIMSAKSAEELEFLYAPYKPANKGSLADRAKAMGLEVYADRLLYGEEPIVILESIIPQNNIEDQSPSENRRKKTNIKKFKSGVSEKTMDCDLDSSEKVMNGICHIISYNISKHTGVLETIRRLQKVHRVTLQSKKSTASNKKDSSPSKSPSHHQKGNQNDASKYELYFNFEFDVRYIRPHQILAINRGEKLKFLTVKICIPDHFKNDIKQYVHELYMPMGLRYPLRLIVFEKAFEDCFKKKLQPLISRQIRSSLNETAQKASVDVFAKNLKQLLLMSPLKGECILGIDPGFTNGCKLAVISESAAVLETGVLYPHSRNANQEEVGMRLAKILARHNCKLIALGNGTACRETEFWLSNLISIGIVNARYCIVSEQGASIYSCSDIAKKEFPNMDPNQISAVSIARRLNDPLSEYVKIQPRHIGVGMYQHDVNEKVLDETLNDVVSECVSFVGVDINTASLSILKHVAGLTEKKAEKILEYRNDNGLFSTRKDLLKVKTIGEKTFVQFAGFIRIEPRTCGKQLDNPLDCTWVHPESYEVAKNIISKCNLNLKDVGQPEFISKINQFSSICDMNQVVKTLGIPKERLEMVLLALKREPLKDYRADFGKRPLFKQGFTRLSDLSEGDVVTGAVTNITHFGAFVDIGVENDGLIHKSHMNNSAVSLGDRVTASIISIDAKRRRIGLRLEPMLTETDTSFTFANE